VSKTITALHVVDKDKIVLSIPDKENIENDSDVLAKLVALRLGGSPAIKYRLMVEIPSKGNQQWKSLMDKSSRIVKEIRLGSMGLTGRQVEVLRGIVNGLRNKEISSLLHITERTVKFHVSRLLIKYNCTNRVELSDRCRDLAQEVVMAQLPPASVNDP
jgi:DNA-binding NarL/FixJ family response regulator